MSKFIEVLSGNKRWVLNVKQIQCVVETYVETFEKNAKVYFGEEDELILDENYDHFLNRLAQISEVEEL